MKRVVACLVALATFGVLFVADAAPAHAWGSWTEIPGNGATLSAPAAVGNEVFVRGTNDRIYGTRRTGSSSWTGWYEVPGGGFTLSAPAVVRIPNGIYLFVRGTDNYVYGNRRNGSQATGQWTGWHRVGWLNPSIYYNGKTYSSPTAISMGNDRVDVFIRGTNDRIYQLTLVNYVQYGGTRGYWFEVPGGGTTYAGPAAVQAVDGSAFSDTYMFVRGTDNQSRIYYNTRASNTGAWSGWRQPPGAGSTYFDPVATSDANGNVEVFVTGTDTYIYRFHGNGWARITSSDRQTVTAPGAAYTSWGLCVFIRGTNDRIYRNCN